MIQAFGIELMFKLPPFTINLKPLVTEFMLHVTAFTFLSSVDFINKTIKFINFRDPDTNKINHQKAEKNK